MVSDLTNTRFKHAKVSVIGFPPVARTRNYEHIHGVPPVIFDLVYVSLLKKILVVKMKKKTGFSPGLYQLDMLSLPDLVSKVVDKVVHYYLHLSIEQVNEFYIKHINQKIA